VFIVLKLSRPLMVRELITKQPPHLSGLGDRQRDGDARIAVRGRQEVAQAADDQAHGRQPRTLCFCRRRPDRERREVHAPSDGRFVVQVRRSRDRKLTADA